MWYNINGKNNIAIINKFIEKDVGVMDKQEKLTLEEARQELEKWLEVLDSWQELSSGEKFSQYYKLSQISAPFVDKSYQFTSQNSHITEQEQEWSRILVDLVYFRRGVEKIYKAKEDDVEENIQKTKEMLNKLLEEYDNYMAGE